ncbi:LysR family transcriptional regulator [Auraticoccus monumenti]|uniref:DNA-binding transcriptional regulator, LysR family n=1 Tax=Auraticoccus monumenti TaxID=675864 RepID=A0A1G6Z3B2_9ACTN|nr:LysR family transcriptional regulator [Auraticoccus monumenti]SDD97254.1 DNA-binding transcriptional regulator, LysR family [Auraticoccus monumenti]
MDVVEALRAFRAVALTGSFTRGAERCGVPQPVVSRRVAALERVLGVELLERTSRSVTITEVGRRVLPHAEELVAQWDQVVALTGSQQPPLVVALPLDPDPRALATISQGLPDHDVRFLEAGREERQRAWQSGRADVALLAAPPEPGTIDQPLGVALADPPPGAGSFSLAWLRRPVRERDRPPRVVHLQPEDDVAHVRDPLQRLVHAHGLRTDQLLLTPGRTDAMVRVHERGDLLLCTRSEADAAGLAWLPVRGVVLVRAHRVAHRGDLVSDVELDRLRRRLARAVSA